MQKTMVYLTPEQHRRLKQQAESEKRSMAELIREAVDRYVAPTAVDYYGFVGAGQGDMGGNVSEAAEKELKRVLKNR